MLRAWRRKRAGRAGVLELALDFRTVPGERHDRPSGELQRLANTGYCFVFAGAVRLGWKVNALDCLHPAGAGNAQAEVRDGL
jgi:hypothetical protein